MLYSLLRAFVRLGLHWYIADLRKKDLSLATYAYPSIVVSNHPNSFFDALLLAAYAPVEICFLARGDAFRHPLANWFLRSLYMLPIYKGGDDAEAAIKNEFTYHACKDYLRSGKHVLIFPEGRSHNLWTLQHFMPAGLRALLEAGAAAELPIQVQPYILHYSSYCQLPKAVELQALVPIDATDYYVDGQLHTSSVIAAVRDRLAQHMPAAPLQQERTSAAVTWMHYPARLGYYSHYWYYRLWSDFIRKKTAGTIFFDSLLFAALLFTYPLLLLLCSIVAASIFGFWGGLLVAVVLPFSSYCYVQQQAIPVFKGPFVWKGNRL